MAPALTEAPVDPQSVFSYKNPSSKIFPDGIKTSGQCNPEPSLLKPYDQFPKEVTGPTVWNAEDYKNNPEQWVHHFSEEEVQEMSDTADAFMASETPLTGITKVRNFSNMPDVTRPDISCRRNSRYRRCPPSSKLSARRS